MPPHPFSIRRTEFASTLVVVMLTIAILSIFIGLALDYTMNTGRMSQRARDLTAEEALANGALEAAYKRWQTYMLGYQAVSQDR